MKKTYSWNLKDGRVVTLEAWCTQTLRDEIVDADGYKVNVGEEVETRANLVAYVDGEKYDSCWNTAFWQVIDTKQAGVKKIWGIKGIGFTEERAFEIEAFLNDVIESGKSEEVKAYDAEKAAEKKAKAISEIEEQLAEAERSGIYTKEEAEIRRQSYINVYNEGGSGYVPHFYSQEEVNELRRELAGLKA